MSEIISDLSFVSFDTETTGPYPLNAEVCELAAVKWQNHQVVDQFSTLLKPSAPMREENIRIHGITNQMVESAPLISEKVAAFREFIEGSIVMAHHAPFDLGFMAIEFEKAQIPLPTAPVICTSLLARAVFPESSNHRLQTLIGFLKLEQGQAHRAFDDAKACLQVTLKCIERLSQSTGELKLESLLAAQGGALHWDRFSMATLNKNEVHKKLIDATQRKVSFEMVYEGGSNPGQPRMVVSEGIVRSLDGDYLVARETDAQKTKRFLLAKIKSVHY